MKTDLNVGSKVKVVNTTSKYYRYRGVISEILYQQTFDFETNKLFNDPYAFICTLHLDAHKCKVALNVTDVECIQKKFIDIEHIKETNEDLGNGIVRKSNTAAFEVGDVIQITEKIDGANASIAYNIDEGKLEVFSRTNLLDGADGLRGFKSYIETKFSSDEFKQFSNLVIFGEWCVGHLVQYNKDWYNVWRVYDIWDKSKKNYCTQAFVKKFCAEHGIEYIHVLYEGPFISWEHCRSFMNKNTYGNSQEGIVIKNQTKLEQDYVRFPKYLKIVNETFKEHMTNKGHKEKVIDPEQQKLEAEAKAKMATIVTEARVRKMILKCVDNEEIPTELTPKCIGTLMKLIPQRIFSDCLKEEPEIVKSVGILAGKYCNVLTSQHVKKIIIGK